MKSYVCDQSMSEELIDWSGLKGYQDLSAVDLAKLPAENRASHVFDVQVAACSILDVIDVQVAPGGCRLNSTSAPDGDPVDAPEAAASPSPYLPPPLDTVESPRPRGSKRPPSVRHEGNSRIIWYISFFTRLRYNLKEEKRKQ